MAAGKPTSGAIVSIRKDSGHTVVQPAAPPSRQLWAVPCPRARQPAALHSPLMTAAVTRTDHSPGDLLPSF